MSTLDSNDDNLDITMNVDNIQQQMGGLNLIDRISTNPLANSGGHKKENGSSIPRFQYRTKSSTMNSIASQGINEDVVSMKEVDKMRKAYDEMMTEQREMIMNLKKQLDGKRSELKHVDPDSEEKLSKNFMSVHDFCEMQKTLLDSIKDTRSGSQPIHRSQPIFRGLHDEDIEEWLYALNTNFDISKIREEDKLTHAAAFVRGRAREVLDRIRKSNPRISWNEFQRKFRGRFKSENYENKIYEELIDLRQTGPMEDFVDKFLYLVEKLGPGYDEKFKVSWFLKKIDGQIYEKISYRNFKNLDEVVEAALEEDRYVNKRKSEKIKQNKSNYEEESVEVNFASQSRKPKFSGCYYCGKTGHIAAQCFKAKWDKRQDYEKKNASFRKRSQTPYPRTRSQSRESSNNNWKKFDYKSKKKPKYRSNRSKKESSDESMSDVEFTMDVSSLPSAHGSDSLLDKSKDPRLKLKTKARINGKKVDVLLDTGAVVSVMPVKIARECKIRIKKSKIQIKTASGRKEPIYGITEPARVVVHGCETKLEFLVMPDNDQPVLLGGDWHVKSGVGTFMKDQRLVFGDKVVYIDDEIVSKESEEIDADEALMCGIVEPGEEEEFFEDFFETDKDKIQEGELIIGEADEKCEETKRKFKRLLEQFSDVFATSLEDLGNPCPLEEHKINTINETPIFQYPYRKSPKENDLIKEEVDKMLKANIIRPSNSPWSAPALMIPKKDGSLRFCVDYRLLNQITVQDPFPVPRTEDIFDRLAQSKYFSTLDLKAGYWQFPVHRDSIAKTAFSTNDGHYEFLRLPFGLRNAPAQLSRVMRQIFSGVKFVEVYFDDMTIHSNSIEEHFDHIKFVFSKLREYNLKINASKGEWFKKSVKVLGHIISEKTIKMDPEKIRAIEDFKVPSCVADIQRFLGLTGHYRRFVRDFSHIAAPIYTLLKKDSKWKWTEDCHSSFEELKKRLTSYPILRQPDFSKPFILYTDASGIAIGAILCQVDDDGNEYVVAYASRKLKGAELNYGITEKECLAVIWAIKHFRVYLFGKKFKVVTDHSALQWLMKIKEPIGKLARWSIFLQTYEFDIVYRQGKKHQNVDALSRAFDVNLIELYSTEVDEEADSTVKKLDIYEDSGFMHYAESMKFLPGTTKKQCKRIKKLSKKYKLIDEKMYFIPNEHEPENKFEVPRVEERKELIHTSHMLGHFAANETYQRIREKYYWKGMTEDIRNQISRCLQCIKFNNTGTKEHPAKSIPVTGLHDKIGIDLVFGLPKTLTGFIGILVIIEYLSKYVWAVGIKSKEALEIARRLFEYISLFGAPKGIQSDQGKEFLNKIIKELSRITGVEHRITSAYHPRTNGLVENFNKTLVCCIRKHAEENPTNWDEWLPYILMAYRSRVHPSTKLTPFELFFGRKMNNLENWQDKPEEEEEYALYRRAEEIRQQYNENIPLALESIEQAQERQRAVQNNRESSKITEETLSNGTKVFIRAVGMQSKLEPKFYGPYTIAGITLIEN